MAGGKKKGGILGGIAGAIFESDPATASPSNVETARPVTPFGGLTPTFQPGVPTAAAPVPPLPGQAPVSYAPPMASIAAEPDPEAIAAVTNAVYLSFEKVHGRQSTYTRFIEMHEALGRPADTTMALRALANADKTTFESLSAKVAQDVGEHLVMLESFRNSVDADFAAEVQNRLGSKDAEVAELERLNEVAAAEIRRHSEETQARVTDISRLKVERAEQEAAIGRGKARMDAAEDSVQTDLVRAQQLFSTKA